MEIRLFRLVIVISFVFALAFSFLSAINYINFSDTTEVMRELFQSCQSNNGKDCLHHLDNEAVRIQGNRAQIFLACATGIPVFLFLIFFAGQFVITGTVRKPKAKQPKVDQLT